MQVNWEITVIICKCSIYSLCWCPQVAKKKKKINVFVSDQNNTSFFSLGLKCHFLRVSFIFMYRAVSSLSWLCRLPWLCKPSSSFYLGSMQQRKLHGWHHPPKTKKRGPPTETQTWSTSNPSKKKSNPDPDFGVQRIIRKTPTLQLTWFPRPTEMLPLISLVANLTDYGKVVFAYLTASDILL